MTWTRQSFLILFIIHVLFVIHMDDDDMKEERHMKLGCARRERSDMFHGHDFPDQAACGIQQIPDAPFCPIR